MPKNPMYLDKAVLANGGSLVTAAGTEIISVSSAGVPSIKADIKEALASGKIYVGSALGVTSEVSVSGDATLSNTGVLTVTGSTGVFAAGGKITPALNGGAASASGLFMGAGTSVAPATTAVAEAKFMEFRTESTATSGDSRGLYWRHAINGAGLSGESIRAFTKLTAAAANVRGAHLSLDIDAGSASGVGFGVDSQILLGDAALTGGNYAVSNIEAYAGGSSTSIAGVTKFSMQRFSLGGDGTGTANIDANATLFDFAGFTAGSGNMIDTDITALTGKAGIAVTIDGVLYGYIPVVTGS